MDSECAELERRAAVATLSGEELGELPTLWLLRQALDDYVCACKFYAAHKRCAAAAWAARPHFAEREQTELVGGYRLSGPLRTAYSSKPVIEPIPGGVWPWDVANAALQLYGSGGSLLRVIDRIERETDLALYCADPRSDSLPAQ